MKTKFTPGPWELHVRGKYDVSIERQGVLICNPSIATDNAGLAPGEDIANAHLIASAPDLLAALETADAMFERVGYPRSEEQSVATIRAAIAKATL